MVRKRKVAKTAESPAMSGRVTRSAAAKSSSLVERKKAESEGKVKEDIEAEEEAVMTVIVVEHCTQSRCDLFQRKAIQVKTALESSECAVVVKLNPEEPRKGCFEIRLLAEDKTFFSLVDMKPPFQPLKNVDINLVIANIINKLTKAMMTPWSKDQMHALLYSIVYNRVFPKTASTSDWKNIQNDPMWPILKGISWKVLKFKSLHLVRPSEMWRMRELNEIVAAMVTHKVFPESNKKDDWLSMRFDPQFSILRVRPWKELKVTVEDVMLQWDASGAVRVDPEAEEDADLTVIVVEHCTQCDLFKMRAIQVKEALESSECAISVWLNPGEPRRGCFQIRDLDQDVTFISLLDMKPPFQPLKNLDLDKVIRDIINRIRSRVMEIPWLKSEMSALLTGLVIHKVFPEYAEESDWQKIRNDHRFSILRSKSWKALKYKSLHLVHYKESWKMPEISMIIRGMITHGVLPTSEAKDGWLAIKFDPEFSSLRKRSWRDLMMIVEMILSQEGSEGID